MCACVECVCACVTSYRAVWRLDGLRLPCRTERVLHLTAQLSECMYSINDYDPRDVHSHPNTGSPYQQQQHRIGGRRPGLMPRVYVNVNGWHIVSKPVPDQNNGTNTACTVWGNQSAWGRAKDRKIGIKYNTDCLDFPVISVRRKMYERDFSVWFYMGEG